MIETLAGLKKWNITLINKHRGVVWENCFARTKEEAICLTKKTISDDWVIDNAERNRNITAEDIINYIAKRKREMELSNMANATADEDINTTCLDIILSELSQKGE